MPVKRPNPLPFAFVGENPVLDFTNTVSWGRGELTEERLLSYDAFRRWAREAGLPVDHPQLSRHARANRGLAARALTAALEVRAELHELFFRAAAGEKPPIRALERLNRRLHRLLGRMELSPDSSAEGAGRVRWRLADPGALDAPIAWLVWEAARLLAADEPVKHCANDRCGWLFIDRSRRGNRRWCEMRVCGSRQKARSYYRRRKTRSSARGR